jgi:hypothetical protein
MISPKLLDFSPFFFLISSPLGTADFLVLLELSGDGYSLLCSKKQPPRHNTVDLYERKRCGGFLEKSTHPPSNESPLKQGRHLILYFKRMMGMHFVPRRLFFATQQRIAIIWRLK